MGSSVGEQTQVLLGSQPWENSTGARAKETENQGQNIGIVSAFPQLHIQDGVSAVCVIIRNLLPWWQPAQLVRIKEAE